MLLAAVLVALGAGAHGSAFAADEGAAELDVSHFSYFEGWAANGYALDLVPRFVEDTKRVRCDTGAMVVHRSRALRYGVRVHPAFAERLQRFEAFVSELAREHYGRAPRRLVHHGAFACRRARHRRERVSEHALGNAIDLEGFDFGRLPRGAAAPEAMPRRMRRAFSLRVGRHWAPRRARDAYHARFLHRLAEELRERPDIFHGIVGPPRPRHHSHLHLDAAPWRYAMFGYDRVDEDEGH